MNIMLTCAGRRHNLAMHFREALAGRGLLIGTDMSLTAPALAACDRHYQVPAVTAPDYLEQIIGIIERESVKMVFSLNDLEIGLLSENRKTIEARTGATLYLPDPETLEICADKLKTFEFAQNLGIPAIPTFKSVEEATGAVDTGAARFPMIVKPRWGSASIGIEPVWDREDLQTVFDRCIRTVTGGALASLGTHDAVVIQQMMTGPEFGADMLFDKDYRFVGVTVKRKLGMRAGETDKAVSVSAEPFQAQVEQIAAALSHRGNLDCDFLEQDGVYYLLELNPRFGGGYTFTHEAGANHIQFLVNDYLNIENPPYSYQTGKAFAKWDLLVSVPAPDL